MRLFFAAQNIRSFKKMRLIELKPITLLLGANSSGKSSFLKLFPLLRQSVASAESPIIWNGRVSFGNYASSVTDHKSADDISFHFRVSDVKLRNEILQLEDSESEHIVENYFSSIDYSVVVGLVGKRTVMRKISCNIAEHGISVEILFNNKGYEVDSFQINGKNVNKPDKFGFSKPLNVDITTGSIFPGFGIKGRRPLLHRGTYRATITDVIYEILHGLLVKTTSGQNINSAMDELMANILKSPEFGKDEILKGIENSKNELVIDFYNRINSNETEIETVNFLSEIFWTFTSLNAVTEIFREFFKESSYVQSERADGKPNYSFDDQYISEVDPNGMNAPMILASFNNRERMEFATWLERIFGVKLKIKKVMAEFQIVFDRGTSEVNFAYSGYGISQILPILTLLWQTTREDTNHKIQSRRGSFLSTVQVIKPITIEQPESHLHPRFQSKIADLLAFVLEEKSETLNPIFVIETHSKAFVSRLGRLIEDKRISRNDVNVVLFSDKPHNFDLLNSEASDDYCSIRETSFDRDGVLEDWPLGFLG